MTNDIEKKILESVDDTKDLYNGAYNIRSNGKSVGRNTTRNISIINKKDKSGIDVIISPNTINENVHVPVIIANQNIKDTVYNTFDVGENSKVTIVAGCGIHNCASQKTEHEGIHNIIIHKGANVKYIEKHYAESSGKSQKSFHTKTIVEIEEDGVLEMDLVQIKGVDDGKKEMDICLHKNAHLIITERIFTEESQVSNSKLNIKLEGENSSAQIVSRSVAKDDSSQTFYFMLEGNNKSRGHIECNSIIMNKAHVMSVPALKANCEDAELIHEAAIGKIASDQLMKLMTLGLTENEAENTILKGFLK